MGPYAGDLNEDNSDLATHVYRNYISNMIKKY